MIRLVALASVWLAACSPDHSPDAGVPPAEAPAESPGVAGASDLPGAVVAPDAATEGPGGLPVLTPRGDRAARTEAFAAFFDVFRDDTTFQRTRVAPTFVASSPNPMGDGTVEGRTFIPHTMTFEGGESVQTSFVAGDARHVSAADVPAGAQAVEFRLDGTDNGISVGYRFERGADGRWRLARITDASM